MLPSLDCYLWESTNQMFRDKITIILQIHGASSGAVLCTPCWIVGVVHQY